MPLTVTADKYLNDEQVAQLRACVKARADRARANGTRRGIDDEFIVYLLLETGLRAKELLELELRDLPCCHGKDIIQVRLGKRSGGKRKQKDPQAPPVLLGPNGEPLTSVVSQNKGPKPRMVDLGEPTVQRLNEYITTCRAGAKPEDPLLVGANGKRLTYMVLLHKIKNLGRLAGVPILSKTKGGCHRFRHTRAFQLYRETHNLRLLQEELGHADPKTTAVYAHLEVDKPTKAALNRLAQ